MRSIKFLALSILLVSAFSIAATAQTTANKIAIIDTAAFYAEKGIARYKAESTKLNAEFKADGDALNAMGLKLENLGKEIQAMQANKSVPIDQNAYRTKVVEYQALEREYKFKKDDLEKRYQGRQAELLAPVNKDVGEKLTAFAKSKGLDMVLDLNNLYRDGSILYLNEAIDITDEFIKYYNAIPAGSAAK